MNISKICNGSVASYTRTNRIKNMAINQEDFNALFWREQLIKSPAVDSNGGVRRFYSGVGSRSTPIDIQQLMTSAAAHFRQLGFSLRSGAAAGADSACEAGAGDDKQIYLPYQRFNRHPSPLWQLSDDAVELAKTLHPAWHRCNEFAKQAHTRNTFQVLGFELDAPSAFMLCYTPDGARTEMSTTNRTGGTRTAIVLAHRRGIPIMNLGYAPHATLLRSILSECKALPDPVDDPTFQRSVKAVLKGLGPAAPAVDDPHTSPEQAAIPRRGFRKFP